MRIAKELTERPFRECKETRDTRQGHRKEGDSRLDDGNVKSRSQFAVCCLTSNTHVDVGFRSDRHAKTTANI